MSPSVKIEGPLGRTNQSLFVYYFMKNQTSKYNV